MRVVLTALSVLLLASSIAVFVGDQRSQLRPQQFSRTYQFNLRRPEIADTLHYAPSSATAADVLADATLRDLLASVNLTELTPEARQAWIESAGHQDAQMRDAIELMLDGISEQPGWPYHQLLLSQLVFARGAQALSADLVRHHESWSVPLWKATVAAPGDARGWQSLALAYLQTWPSLSETWRGNAAEVFRHSFADPDFVRVAFAPATAIIGTQTAVEFLPDIPAALRTAFDHLVSTHDIDDAFSVYHRWDAAEWRQRADDLAATEFYVRRDDYDQARSRAQTWMSEHSPWEYASPNAVAQVARVLELAPANGGRWDRDVRTSLVRYLMVQRAAGGVVDRTLQSLEDVPASVQAQANVLASDVGTAQRVARSADTFGTLEWTPYILELARYWIARKDGARAAQALTLLPVAARDECDARIVRASLGEKLAIETPVPVTRETKARAEIAACFARGEVSFDVGADQDAIVDYGWNGIRSATVLVRRDRPVTVTAIPPYAGSHVFFVRSTSSAVTPALRLSGPRSATGSWTTRRLRLR